MKNAGLVGIILATAIGTAGCATHRWHGYDEHDRHHGRSNHGRYDVIYDTQPTPLSSHEYKAESTNAEQAIGAAYSHPEKSPV